MKNCLISYYCTVNSMIYITYYTNFFGQFLCLLFYFIYFLIKYYMYYFYIKKKFTSFYLFNVYFFLINLNFINELDTY